MRESVLSAPALTRTDDAASLRGMILGVAAYTLFAVHDAVVKGVIFDLPVVQILFVRSVVITLICLGIGRRKMLRDLVASPNKPMLLVRALLMLAAWCLYYPAGQQLKLADRRRAPDRQPPVPEHETDQHAEDRNIAEADPGRRPDALPGRRPEQQGDHGHRR